MPMSVLPKRRNIRLTTVEYNGIGEYFITLCVEQRLALFGTYQNPGIRLNAAGHAMDDQWRKLISRFPSISLDAYVVMPDHFHAIVHIVAGDINVAPTVPKLGTLVGMFKHHTNLAYLNGIQQYGWPMYHKRLWQRNYYEHIIRNEQDYNECQAYILNNPYQWEQSNICGRHKRRPYRLSASSFSHCSGTCSNCWVKR